MKFSRLIISLIITFLYMAAPAQVKPFNSAIHQDKKGSWTFILYEEYQYPDCTRK